MELEMLKKIIADVLDADPETITEETSFVDDLGADSLDLFQIIMAVEEELNLEVDEDVASGIKTVGDAMELIQKTVG